MSSNLENVQARKPWAASIATILAFLALGPPLGGLLFALIFLYVPGFAVVNDTTGKTLADLLSGGILFALITLPFSYIVGGLQAGFCGLALVVWGWLKGKPPAWLALVASIGGFAFFYLTSIAGTFAEYPRMTLAMLIVHVVPALLCWLVSISFWRASR